MDLRDLVEVLVGLDDDQRAITNEINRALDGLERAVLPAERFGISRDDLATLRERLSYGSGEAATLQGLGDRLRARVLDEARACAEEVARAATQDPSAVQTRLVALSEHLAESLDRVRAAHEQVGRLKHLAARRSDVEAQLRKVRGPLDDSEETQELLGVVLAARLSAAGRASHDARGFLEDAERLAAEDGILAGIAANTRALREALRTGADSRPIGADLVRRVVDAGVHLAAEREDHRRHLAQLARDAERRQEITHGLFQAVTKASEVIDTTTRLSARVAAGEKPSSAEIEALRASCLEHGLVALLLDLRGVRLERTALDTHLSELSATLGDLFALLSDRPATIEQLGPVWEEIAEVDASALEQRWEGACRHILGMEGEGLELKVDIERLTEIARAPSAAVWQDALLEQLDESRSSVERLVRQLDSAARVLEGLARENAASAQGAAVALERLVRFESEVRRAAGTYYDALQARLLSPETGMTQVEARAAALDAVRDLRPDTPPELRREVTGEALARLRRTFERLEAMVPPAGGDAVDWRRAEEEARNESLGAQRSLAGSLARLRRLRALLFPPVPAPCRDAMALARGLREQWPPVFDEAAVLRDRLGEALEALHAEKLYLEHLALPLGADVRVMAALSRERNRRLLDLYESSLELLFRLLTLLGHEVEQADEDDRAGYLSWMEELLLHARDEVGRHLACLEDCLFDLEDNAERLGRWLVALDAYRAWALGAADAEAGASLAERHGPKLFEAFETPFGRLGARTLEAVDAETADWRVSSVLESLLDLYEHALSSLAARPTATDVGSLITSLRQRASRLRDRVIELADASADAPPGPAVPPGILA